MNRFVTSCFLVALTAALALSGIARADVLPTANEIRVLLEETHRAFASLDEGELPAYIPALTEVDPERFGIAVVMADGTTVSVGDANVPFVIMSAAKPFTMALVMKQKGRAAVREYIGVEPTGEPFNSVEVIESNPQRSVNPMVNAGAMAAVSLLEGSTPKARWTDLFDWYQALANSKLSLNQDVYRSVSQTGERNKAIAALLKSYDRLYGEPEDVRDVYNRQSSVNVTVEQLAMMGAVLANDGVQPRTGERLMAPEQVSGTLAVMTLAGMYDASGEWAWNVGLPAKSGVGGGVFAVAPGKLSIAAFSPKLDERGNSVRAQAAIRRISNVLGLGLFGASDTSADPDP